MIDQGLVMCLAQASPPMTGFAGELPKDALAVPEYRYSTVDDEPETGLQFVSGLVMRVFQFDCYGATAALAMGLATNLNAAINGKGQMRLPDPDSTYISICRRIYRNGPKFSAEARNFWVMLRYRIWYSDATD